MAVHRVGGGVEGLLEMFRRGLTLIYGLPGTGKTSLALWAVSMLGLKTLWVSLYESRDDVAAEAGSLGLDIGNVDIVDLVAVPREQVLLELILERSMGYEALVIDGVNAVGESREVASALHRMSRDVPIVAIGEVSLEGTPFPYMADNIIMLEHELGPDGQYRHIRVLKSRGRRASLPHMGFVIGRGITLVGGRGAFNFPPTEALAFDQGRVQFPLEYVEYVARVLSSRVPWVQGLGVRRGSRIAVEVADIGALSPLVLLGGALGGRKLVVTEYVEAIRTICDCFDFLETDPQLLRFEGYLSDLLSAARNYDVVIVGNAERLTPRRVRWIMDAVFSVRPSVVMGFVFDGGSPRDLFDWVLRASADTVEIARSPLPLPWRRFHVSVVDGKVVVSRHG